MLGLAGKEVRQQIAALGATPGLSQDLSRAVISALDKKILTTKAANNILRLLDQALDPDYEQTLKEIPADRIKKIHRLNVQGEFCRLVESKDGKYVMHIPQKFENDLTGFEAALNDIGRERLRQDTRIFKVNSPISNRKDFPRKIVCYLNLNSDGTPEHHEALLQSNDLTLADKEKVAFVMGFALAASGKELIKTAGIRVRVLYPSKMDSPERFFVIEGDRYNGYGLKELTGTSKSCCESIAGTLPELLIK